MADTHKPLHPSSSALAEPKKPDTSKPAFKVEDKAPLPSQPHPGSPSSHSAKAGASKLVTDEAAFQASTRDGMRSTAEGVILPDADGVTRMNQERERRAGFKHLDPGPDMLGKKVHPDPNNEAKARQAEVMAKGAAQAAVDAAERVAPKAKPDEEESLVPRSHRAIDSAGSVIVSKSWPLKRDPTQDETDAFIKAVPGAVKADVVTV